MLQNAYFLAKIGADTAENEQRFAEILPKIGNCPTGPLGWTGLQGYQNEFRRVLELPAPLSFLSTKSKLTIDRCKITTQESIFFKKHIPCSGSVLITNLDFPLEVHHELVH